MILQSREKINLVNHLTIIIPTHNRPQYLSRAMKYWKNYTVNILIIDSSSEKYTDILPSSVYYIHKANEGYIVKILYALNQVKTKFVAFCADDDFSFFDSLCFGLSFLQKNDDYSCIQGKFIGFFLNDINNPHNLDKGIKQITLDQDQDIERLVALSKNYFHYYYALHRTDNLRLIFSEIHKHNLQDYYLMEALVAFCTAISGKIANTDKAWSARERDVKPDRTQLAALPKRLLNNELAVDTEKFIMIMSEVTRHLGGEPKPEYYQQALKNYSENYPRKHPKKKPIVHANKFYRLLHQFKYNTLFGWNVYDDIDCKPLFLNNEMATWRKIKSIIATSQVQ